MQRRFPEEEKTEQREQKIQREHKRAKGNYRPAGSSSGNKFSIGGPLIQNGESHNNSSGRTEIVGSTPSVDSCAGPSLLRPVLGM